MLISSKIINRILKFKGFKTDSKLAKHWNVSPTAVTSWRTRNSIPFKKIIAFCEEEGVSLDYIFTGEGEMTRKPEKKIGIAENSTYIYKEESTQGRLDDDPGIADLLESARRILKSGNQVALDALERNIRYFDHATKTEKRLKNIEEKILRMEDEKTGEPDRGK